MADKHVENDAGRSGRTPQDKVLTKAGVAVGVGSAALVAALLYAGRPKKQKPAK